MSVLVHAFLGMEDDEIDIFTRNMSQRACDMIMEESKLKREQYQNQGLKNQKIFYNKKLNIIQK